MPIIIALIWTIVTGILKLCKATTMPWWVVFLPCTLIFGFMLLVLIIFTGIYYL